jgi:hypothetical protein
MESNGVGDLELEGENNCDLCASGWYRGLQGKRSEHLGWLWTQSKMSLNKN